MSNNRIKGLADHVKKIVAAMDRQNFPKSIGCSHLGIGFPLQGLSIDFLSSGGRLLVTIYCNRYTKRKEKACKCCGHVTVIKPSKEIVYSRRTHLARAQAIADALGTTISNSWNGMDRSTGISVVFGRRAPDSLMVALATGSQKPGACEAFEKWITEAL